MVPEPQTNRQGRLQYTAPQLSMQCNYKLLMTLQPFFQGICTRPWCWGCRLICLNRILHRCTQREWVRCLQEDQKCICMIPLDSNIWQSSVRMQTRVRLYNVYILPVLFYRADTWNMTKVSSWCLNAFDHDVFTIYYIFHIQRMSPTRKWGVEQVNLQSPQLSQRDDFICSDILLKLIHHKTTDTSFKQPSIVQQIGDTVQLDQGRHVSQGCLLGCQYSWYQQPHMGEPQTWNNFRVPEIHLICRIWRRKIRWIQWWIGFSNPSNNDGDIARKLCECEAPGQTTTSIARKQPYNFTCHRFFLWCFCFCCFIILVCKLIEVKFFPTVIWLTKVPIQSDVRWQMFHQVSSRKCPSIIHNWWNFVKK